MKKTKQRNLIAMEDRISILPESLILHILSFLPTKKSATTSTLSKKWQYLWTFVPVLNFCESDEVDEDGYLGNYNSSAMFLSDFVSFINRSIILNQSPNLDKFRVRFSYRKAYVSDVDVWLRFAARKKVKELDINFSTNILDDDDSNDEDEADDDDKIYCLPVHVYVDNPSLESLKLTSVGIEHGRMINWKSLKVLSLVSMPILDDFMVSLFSATPSLELLEVLRCYMYRSLDIKSAKLKKLVLDCIEGFSSKPVSLKITAPYLQALHITGSLYDFNIINVSSLVDVSLSPDSKTCATILVKLLGSLRHVKKLILHSLCLKALSTCTEKMLPSMRSSWVTLRDTSLSENQLPGMARLLSQTHLLETLVIEVGKTLSFEQLETSEPNEENYWASHQGSSAIALLHLKTVRIVGFLATENEVELLVFLLKKAPNLEKMIINPDNTISVSLKKSLEVAQMLLKFPRLSHEAVVLFC